jgi:two-component system, NtrC family, nitrogen regulation response regulator NtrX
VVSGVKGRTVQVPPARILIADDEPEVLDLIRQVLVHRGYEVATANSGDEAPRAVSAFRPDVLLVDMAMPGLSGTEVLAELRQQGVGIPVIAMSGLATAATGFFARLEKPFDFSRLTSTVAEAVAQPRGGA